MGQFSYIPRLAINFDSTFQNREILRYRKRQQYRKQCYHFPNSPLQVRIHHCVCSRDGVNYHVRVTIIGLIKAGKNAKQIHTLLKLLKVSEHLVYRVLALYNDTGDIVEQPRSGWPHTVCTKKVVKAVRARIDRNPVRRQETIRIEMNIAPRTLSHVLKDYLGLCAFKRCTGQLLTPRMMRKSEKIISFVQ